jgi:hypothetical protein
MTSQENNFNPHSSESSSSDGMMSNWLSEQREASADIFTNDSSLDDPGNDSETNSTETLNASQMNAVLHFDEGQGRYGETGADVATGVSSAVETDPHEAIQERPLHRQGIPKFVLIGTGISLILMVLASIFGGIFGSGSTQTAKKPKPDAQKPVSPAATAVDQPSGEVLTALALTEQDQQIKALNAKDPKAAKPNAQQAQQPSATRPPRSAVVPVREIPRSSQPRPRFQAQPSSQPVRFSNSSRPAFLSSAPARPAGGGGQLNQDPNSAWLAAAQTGSFGQGGSNQGQLAQNNGGSGSFNGQFPNSSPFPNNNFPVQQVINRPPASTVSGTAPGWPSIDTNDEALILAGGPGSLPKSLMVGTSAKATLATPVAWDASSTGTAGQQPKRYVVVLEEGLQAADGSVALPAGTQLVAQQSAFNSSGLIDLTLVSAMVEVNGQSQEVNLPAGALQVNGQGGKPIFASSRGGKKSSGGFLSTLGQVALGTVRQASELYTRPNTSIASSGDTTFVSSNNRSPNILAGALQGGSDALLNNFEAQSQRALSQSQNSQSPIWYANAGTPLEIYVNQSVAIPGLWTEKTQLAAAPQEELSSPQASEPQPELAEQPEPQPEAATGLTPAEVKETQLRLASQQQLRLALEVQDNSTAIQPNNGISPPRRPFQF